MVGTQAPTPAAQAAERHLLEDFARASSGWFWEMDADLRFVYMSDSVEAVTGVPPQWHYGKSRADIGTPASVSVEDWSAHLAQLERREPFSDFVFQRQGPDGTKWMQTSGVPFFDADGVFAGYRGIATDVTARVEAERRANRLVEAIENLDELFVLWDEQDRLVACNARFREINASVIETTRPGTPFETHVRAAAAAGLYPEARGREEAWIQQRLARHACPGAPTLQRRQDGRWLLLSEHRMPDGACLTLSADITQQKSQEEAIKRQHELLRIALGTIPDGVLVLDAAGELVAWNEQFFDILDLEREKLLGSTDPGEAILRVLEAIGAEPGDCESGATLGKEQQLPGGRWVESRTQPFPEGGSLTVYRDIDKARRLRYELEQQASTDALTGLLSRRAFMARAGNILSTNHDRLEDSLLLLDVDHFKLINDEHGHACGDEVLRVVARACIDAVREEDLVGRIGGEEFAFLCPGLDVARALDVAERIRRSAAACEVPTAEGPVRVTVSIGAAGTLSARPGLAALLQEADAALYDAKRAGRDRIAVGSPTVAAHAP